MATVGAVVGDRVLRTRIQCCGLAMAPGSFAKNTGQVCASLLDAKLILTACGAEMGNSAVKSLPYTAGEAVQSSGGVFNVYEGVSTSDASAKALVWKFDKKVQSGRLTLAQNALKRLRMMRHPYVLKFLVRGQHTNASDGAVV